MKKAGYRMIIFVRCKEIPEYLHKEFEGENVTLVPIFYTDPERSFLYRLICKLAGYFFWNKTARRRCLYDMVHSLRQKPLMPPYFHLFLLRVISAVFGNIKALRLFVRWVSFRFVPERVEEVAEYFDLYKPDLVFAASITAKSDTVFIKEACRRKITTVSMPKTWDTVTRTYYHVVPDYFLAQNKILIENLVDLQDFPRENIYLVGFSEFDWYARKDIIRSREEHLKKFGLDPNLPVLFFGSQGKWFPEDVKVAKLIYQWVKNDELVKPCQMLVRPHFLFSGKVDPFLWFKDKERVAYDNTYYYSEAFVGKWDPVTPTIVDFINTITHSDVLIIVLSTLALDGACADKPIINALFWSMFSGKKDITPNMAFTSTHYEWIFSTNGTSVAMNPEELKSLINQYLENPSLKSKERLALREKLCYKVDGKSSERMVNAIKDILDSNS